MSSRVVHVSDHVVGAVYIGRAMNHRGLSASPFRNPYRVGQEGDREACIRYYRDDLMRFKGKNSLLPLLPELRGKPLACWCRHDGEERTPANACHGDVLFELIERYTDDELRAMGEGR